MKIHCILLYFFLKINPDTYEEFKQSLNKIWMRTGDIAHIVFA
jgi:hypothetical protein